MSQYVKIKTEHLTGAALDWAVAICEGWEPDRPQDGQLKMEMPHYPGRYRHIIVGDDGSVERSYLFLPSTSWAHGGPLVDKYLVSLSVAFSGSGRVYTAMALNGEADRVLIVGDTALVALCRAVVSATIGAEVDIPTELQWITT